MIQVVFLAPILRIKQFNLNSKVELVDIRHGGGSCLRAALTAGRPMCYVVRVRALGRPSLSISVRRSSSAALRPGHRTQG